MAEDFAKAVDDGLRLSKRLYFGKDRAVAPPRSLPTMDRMGRSLLPTAPMVYAVIDNPAIVDNPDVPSYQPHVHGRCDPPALIPLQMNGIELEVDCYLDTAIIRITGSWRVHCVMGSRSWFSSRCEVDAPRKSYRTSLITLEDILKMSQKSQNELMGAHFVYYMRWSQKLSYREGNLTLDVPFTFPEYVNPCGGRRCRRRRKIASNVNVGSAAEVLCRTTSHPFKGLFESDIWWDSPTISSYGLMLIKRDMFCMYLYPGKEHGKVFKKKIVFVVDISGSMQGKALNDVKNVLSTALSKLHPEDMFNIMLSTTKFVDNSASMEMAPRMLPPRMLNDGGSDGSVLSFFFFTDGAVENERHICDVMRKNLTGKQSVYPRIYTFGIGIFCNYYFLRMLAMIGRGHCDAAYDLDSVEPRMRRLYKRAISTIFVNIAVDAFDDLDEVKVYPSFIPDLSSESLLTVSGRYCGNFPKTVKAKGLLANLDNIVHQAKDIPLDKVVIFIYGQTYLDFSLSWVVEIVGR
ncbi:von Willebrand factor A domain-containing protein 5B1, partial [Cucurbita argyrosperma subsp. argyrosperma]